MAGLLLLAYGMSPVVRRAVDPVGRWQVEYGWQAAFASRAFFGAVLPGVFVFLFKSIRPGRPWRVLASQLVWCGLWGVIGDWFFCFQDCLVGSGRDAISVLLKALIDQLPWTVMVVAPVNSAFYYWLGRDFSFARCRSEFPRTGYVRGIVLPFLIANWSVSVPVTVIVLCFPLQLRVHVQGLILSFWTLLCLEIGRRSASVRTSS